MNLHSLPPSAEVAVPDDTAPGLLAAQLAAHGVELHCIVGPTGAPTFTVNLRGQVRTLHSLPDVRAYVHRMGLSLPAPRLADGLVAPVV